jgi:hypothetical protein
MLSESGKGDLMALTIILTIILGSAVIIGVVAPLMWAILTQHRDQPVAVAAASGARGTEARVARRGRRPQYEPIAWPAR